MSIHLCYLSEHKYLCIEMAFLPKLTTSRFRGPAPLHHTLLSAFERTGVTVQTLHPMHFDEGVVLAQTPHPGFKHQCSTVPALIKLTATEGANMLVQCLKDGAFIPPLQPRIHLQADKAKRAIKAAPKITPADRHIDWSSWTAEEILRRHRVIGPLWNAIVTKDAIKGTEAGTTRLIWSSGFTRASSTFNAGLRPGQPFIKDLGNEKQAVLISTCDDQCLKIVQMKIEGRHNEDPVRSCKHAGLFSGRPIGQEESVMQSGTLRELFMDSLV